jgi:hypothetical protein
MAGLESANARACGATESESYHEAFLSLPSRLPDGARGGFAQQSSHDDSGGVPMHRFGWKLAAMVLFTLLCAPTAHAQLGDQAAALKEALTTGTSDAVSVLGKPGGYLSNPAVKILLPKKLEVVETALRSMGMGPKIDAFVESMNRAAEAAAPKAQPIFLNAIQGMTFSDARQIVSKGGHSATDYFQRKTTPDLTKAFAPIVKQKMAENDVTKQYNDLMGHYQSGPLAMGGLLGGGGGIGNFDINSYVVGKSLDGLFYMVGQEEQKIRTNPAAQVTPLLKQVFGGMH